MSLSTTVEYGEGYQAYESNRSQYTNPYQKLSSPWRRWDTGWLEARDDHQEDSVQVEPEVTGNPIIDAAVEVSNNG